MFTGSFGKVLKDHVQYTLRARALPNLRSLISLIWIHLQENTYVGFTHQPSTQLSIKSSINGYSTIHDLFFQGWSCSQQFKCKAVYLYHRRSQVLLSVSQNYSPYIQLMTVGNIVGKVRDRGKGKFSAPKTLIVMLREGGH
jgi:hypothetical protein